MKFLAPDAAAALLMVERDTGGLVYLDMWRDPVASLYARRSRRTSQLPGYSAHGYGIGIDVDVQNFVNEKKARYEDLLYFMKKRGWVCHRRDGEEGLPESEHFNFLGDMAEKYLTKCTLDPTTWQRAAEERIYERHGRDFQIDLKTAQMKLSQVGMYTGSFTGELDGYTREAIMAFERAWDLTETGTANLTFCRVLAFVTADRQMLPAPSP